MKCPQCKDDCSREETTIPDSDISVRIIYGPWYCSACGWYEGWEIDRQIEAEMEVDLDAIDDDREAIQPGDYHYFKGGGSG